MKASLSQMLAIVCILALGVMTFTPLVQKGHTDGKAHTYISGVQNIYEHIYCMNGHLLTVKIISEGVGVVLSRHEDGGDHDPFRTLNHIYITTLEQSCVICEIVYLPHITSQ